jgi:membrane protein DedA with SNARE-associated domain
MNFPSVPMLGLLWQAAQDEQDLMLNWILIGVLLVIAAILGIIVVKRRMREHDDEYDV